MRSGSRKPDALPSRNGIRIRPARPTDKTQVLEFCKNTWPGGDYIPQVWDEWLRDKNGRFLVAEHKAEPIGIAHAYFQRQNIAWLEGVRIHPSYRGHGLAGRLNKALTRYAAQKGANLARLCTGSSNLASRRHLVKTGFKLLQRFQRLKSDRPLRKVPTGIKRSRKFSAETWRWISRRPEFEKYHQTFSDGWTWYPLDSRAFNRFVKQDGAIFTGSPPTSCSLFSREEDRITLGFAAGNSSEITMHARYLRNMARRRGERVRALIPKGTTMVKALENAGFEKSGTILVYEKRLGSKAKKP